MLRIPYRFMGFRLFSRDSGGGLVIASYHPQRSGTWFWSASLCKNPFGGSYRDPVRRNQWHDYCALPFGYALRISRQDYHLERPQ